MGECNFWCGGCNFLLKKGHAIREEPYPFRASGMDHIFLSNITMLICTGCGWAAPEIPKMEELHKVIARTLARLKRRLTMSEGKFLCSWIGLSEGELAGFVGKAGNLLETHQTYIGDTPPSVLVVMPEAADRFIRYLTLLIRGGDEQEARGVLHKCFVPSDTSDNLRLLFSFQYRYVSALEPEWMMVSST